MDCLTCAGAPLEEKTPLDGLVIDLCATCGGAWMDKGELERFAARAEGFKEDLGRALKTLLPASAECPRCRKGMSRGWIAEAEVEFKICPDCRGIWIGGDPLRRLRSRLNRRSAPYAPSPAAPSDSSLPGRVRTAAVCMAVAAIWLVFQVPARQRKYQLSAAGRSGRTAHDYEREALSHRALAAVAENHGNWEEAEEEYYSVSGLYNAAIVAAAAPSEAWRLEAEYAKAGEAIAKMAVHRQAYAEAEEVQMVRFAIYERHQDLLGQAKVWQELAEMLVLEHREAESIKRFDRAAELYRAGRDRQAADDCRRKAAAARKSSS